FDRCRSPRAVAADQEDNSKRYFLCRACSVGDPESTWALPRWPECLKIVSAYNAALRRVAGKHNAVHVVPVHDAFLDHGIHCRQFWRSHYDWRDPHYWYFENIEDPNDRGYDALRRIFLREISDHRDKFSSAFINRQN